MGPKFNLSPNFLSGAEASDLITIPVYWFCLLHFLPLLNTGRILYFLMEKQSCNNAKEVFGVRAPETMCRIILCPSKEEERGQERDRTIYWRGTNMNRA